MVTQVDTRFILVREKALRPVGDLVTDVDIIVSGEYNRREGGRDPESLRVARGAKCAAQAESVSVWSSKEL